MLHPSSVDLSKHSASDHAFISRTLQLDGDITGTACQGLIQSASSLGVDKVHRTSIIHLLNLNFVDCHFSC